MEKITIFTKGLAMDNPGPAAVGVYVVDSKDKIILELSEAIGNATEVYAEYFAVVRGLQAVEEEFAEKTKEIEFELKLSNNSVQKQLNRKEQVVDPGLVSLFIGVHNLQVSSFPNIKFTKIDNDSNKEVESLANKALAS